MHDDYLMHYGRSIEDVPPPPGRGSGRYPKGSGDNPYQHAVEFIDQLTALKNEGKSYQQIAEILGIKDKYGHFSANTVKSKESNEKNRIKRDKQVRAWVLYTDPKDPKGTTEIGRILGIPEGTVRTWIKNHDVVRKKSAVDTADALKKIVDEKRYVDVSDGAEGYLGVTKTRFKNARDLLLEEGYHEYTLKVNQLQSSHQTTFTTMCPPDVTFGEASANKNHIKPIYDDSRVLNEDGMVVDTGVYKDRIHSVSSDRVQIRYNEEGGVYKDGLIELRPGVKDISIGAHRYAQVRIPVDDTHYIKGMAIYSDDLPKGVDIRFNTNKHVGKPMIDGDKGVLKPMKLNDKGEIDWENPFGASVTQLQYKDKDGKTAYSACNIVHMEGEWQHWANTISSQVGSKQPVSMVKNQLDLDLNSRKLEFETIKNLTNPTIKKKLLIEFGDECDSAATELKGAPFKGQQYHVFIPCPELPDGEVYAPNYKDGTKVAVIRNPHEGTFQIPILTVKNTGSPAEKLIGKNAPDAICINHNAAQQLSGADFDGDSGPVIPLSNVARISARKPIKELIDFDPSEAYPGYEGMKVMKEKNKGREMGEISNLLTDMQQQGASIDEVIRATKHSMVVIDAVKHELDWKKSFKDNRIAELKEKYQDGGGAATIISRAKADTRIPERDEWTPSHLSIDSEGRKVTDRLETGATYTEVKLKGTKVLNEATGRMKTVYPAGDTGGWIGTYQDKNGLYYISKDKDTGKKVRKYVTEDDYTNKREVPKTMTVPAMTTVQDAYELTSGGKERSYKHEIIYADYANACKALGNLARKEWLSVDEGRKDPEAAVKYADEVSSLKSKLERAKMHRPQERQAQLLARRKMDQLKEANPDMTKDQIKKYENITMNRARTVLGLKRSETLVQISDKEWEAIQNKAVSPTVLKSILNYTDSDKLKERAMPRKQKGLSPTMIALAKNMANSDYTNAEIAERLGCSPSTVSRALNGE